MDMDESFPQPSWMRKLDILSELGQYKEAHAWHRHLQQLPARLIIVIRHGAYLAGPAVGAAGHDP